MNLDEHQVRAVRYCVGEVVRRRLLTGAPVPGWLRRLDHTLRMSAHGPETAAGQPESKSEVVDSSEVAAILGCSTRHVRRLAADLDGQHVAGRWIFNRRNVIDYAEGKEKK